MLQTMKISFQLAKTLILFSLTVAGILKIPIKGYFVKQKSLAELFT